MGLTRLRRCLRDMPDYYHDVQSLIDAADRVLENAEVMEDRLKDNQYPEGDDMANFVTIEVERLMSAVARIESVGVAGVLQCLIETVGYEGVARALDGWKECYDQRVAEESDALGDLDEHPF